MAISDTGCGVVNNACGIYRLSTAGIEIIIEIHGGKILISFFFLFLQRKEHTACSEGDQVNPKRYGVEPV